MMLNKWLGSFFKYELIWTLGNEAFDWNIMKPDQIIVDYYYYHESDIQIFHFKCHSVLGACGFFVHSSVQFSFCFGVKNKPEKLNWKISWMICDRS